MDQVSCVSSRGDWTKGHAPRILAGTPQQNGEGRTMGGVDSQPRPLIQDQASERLDSWKEIAAYLKKEVRTVQRWEKNLGLPVRRLAHGKQGTVFAYKSELDSWWRESQSK